MTLVKLFASSLHWSFFMLSKKTAILVRKSLLLCSVLIVCMDMANAATCDLTQTIGGQLPQDFYQAKRLTAQVTPAQQLGNGFTSWTTYAIPQGCSINGNWSVKISMNSVPEKTEDDETYTFRLECRIPNCRSNTKESLLVKVKLTVVFADSSTRPCGTTTKTISTTDITYTNASSCANQVTVMASSTLLQDNKLKMEIDVGEFQPADFPIFSVVNSRLSSSYQSTQYTTPRSIVVALPSPCTFTTTTKNVDLKTINITSVNKNDLTAPINPIQFQITFKDCNAQTMLFGRATLQWTFLSPGGINLNKLKNSAVANPATGVDLQLKAATGQKKNQNCTDMTDLVIKSKESYLATCGSSTSLNALDFTAYYLANGENLQPGEFSSTATLMLDLN